MAAVKSADNASERSKPPARVVASSQYLNVDLNGRQLKEVQGNLLGSLCAP